MKPIPAPITIYVPRDSAAISLGADDVAIAIAAEAARLGVAIHLVRNSSRGLFWLEPLVEVATEAGRIGYGPVQQEDVASLFAAGLGNAHALNIGIVDELPYLKTQERLTFARAGITDPVSLDDYLAHGGYRGLKNALAMAPEAIVAAVTESGLRGRGGAAFPAGIKWKTVLGAEGAQKYIVCNADEGDSGTYADRMVCEGDPFLLIEGMTIAGLAVGATRGYIYLRSEYPHAEAALTARPARHLPVVRWAARARRSDCQRLRERLARREHPGVGQAFRSGSADGRRRLYLRRGNLAAGIA